MGKVHAWQCTTDNMIPRGAQIAKAKLFVGSHSRKPREKIIHDATPCVGSHVDMPETDPLQLQSHQRKGQVKVLHSKSIATGQDKLCAKGQALPRKPKNGDGLKCSRTI